MPVQSGPYLVLLTFSENWKSRIQVCSFTPLLCSLTSDWNVARH